MNILYSLLDCILIFWLHINISKSQSKSKFTDHWYNWFNYLGAIDPSTLSSIAEWITSSINLRTCEQLTKQIDIVVHPHLWALGSHRSDSNQVLTTWLSQCFFYLNADRPFAESTSNIGTSLNIVTWSTMHGVCFMRKFIFKEASGLLANY